MTVIKRVIQELEEAVEKAKSSNRPCLYINHCELISYLKSLASERCVWEEKPDPDFDGAHYYETQCGLLMDDETAYGWFQGDTSHWGNCRCGKRIEVKEADNGY